MFETAENPQTQLAEVASLGRSVPHEWCPHYSEADRDAVRKVLGWLDQHGKTESWLSRLSRVNTGTLNQILKGKYPPKSGPGSFLAMMLEAIKLKDERGSKHGVPFVETSLSKLARAACHRARLYRNFAVLAGYVGVGKTVALKNISASTPSTYLVEADPDMGPGALLQALVEATRAEVQTRGKFSTGTTSEKFRALVRALDGTGALLIVDEAETMQPRALEYLRRIRDKAGVGVVLSGTERLTGLIQPEHGQFDQIRSRVGYWPATVTAITREDADAVTQAGFPDLDLTQDVLDALWRYNDGSIRVLVEDLIPAIRDYGIGKGRPFNAALVKQIATEVLRLKPRKEAA